MSTEVWTDRERREIARLNKLLRGTYESHIQDSETVGGRSTGTKALHPDEQRGQDGQLARGYTGTRRKVGVNRHS